MARRVLLRGKAEVQSERASGSPLCIALVEPGGGIEICGNLRAILETAVQESRRDRQYGGNGPIRRSATLIAERPSCVERRRRHGRDRGTGRYGVCQREPGCRNDGNAGERSPGPVIADGRWPNGEVSGVVFQVIGYWVLNSLGFPSAGGHFGEKILNR